MMKLKTSGTHNDNNMPPAKRQKMDASASTEIEIAPA